MGIRNPMSLSVLFFKCHVVGFPSLASLLAQPSAWWRLTTV